jgi:daunorubicin resistance ABC transporter ATP-binding subunit
MQTKTALGPTQTRRMNAVVIAASANVGVSGPNASSRDGLEESMMAIEVEGVSKRFGSNQALDHVSLSVEPGTVLALLGPNGAGKTTLIRILTTLVVPDSGVARVAGRDVQKEAKTIRSLIGLAGQYASVDELLTGRENLELVGLLYHLERSEYRRRAQDALERMTLTSAADRAVKTYSGGMRRRLDLAASLIGRPPVLLLDEPTTGLDPRTRNDLWSFIEELVDEGSTVLLTTQYMEEAEYLADQIVLLDAGCVVASGTADQLKDRIGSDILEVRVSDSADLERSARFLEPFGQGDLQIDRDLKKISVRVNGRVDALLGAGRELEERGIVLDDLRIRRPSLDDVFLSFTGPSTSATTGALAGAPSIEAGR